MPDYLDENEASRRKLREFCGHLSNADLTRTIAAGWTVSSLLAHLAFWDRRAAALLERWRSAGVEASPVDSDAINEAAKPLCLAIEPRAAMDLCLSSAEQIDAAIREIDPELAKEIQAKAGNFRFNRGTHRMEHLDEIERVLG